MLRFAIPVTLVSIVLGLVVSASAQDAPPRREPGPTSRAKVFEWTSGDGLDYRYYVPKDYDPDKGANLTLILHGSNLTRGWGFANHRAGSFRPDDVVVSPDGTTPTGTGRFNFLGKRKDADRLHALLAELKESFRVRDILLYGHSQGSFFALYYAGEYPDGVDGVVAHASGVWTWTKTGPKGHDQAVVLMHGTRDPVVPYRLSVGGIDLYRKARYPLLRLRSLEGWNHWPAEHNGPVPHTSQQLAWCEGMTTDDPERLRVCFEALAGVTSKERHDYVALYDVARRVVSRDDVPDSVRGRARRAAAAVEALAESHRKALAGARPGKFQAEPWVGHLPMFLRSFTGVPACDEMANRWQKALDQQRKAGPKALREYDAALRAEDPASAFTAGVAAIRSGFLIPSCTDPDLRRRLAQWRKDSRKLRLAKRAVRDYDAIVLPYAKASEEGVRDFDGLNRKVASF